MVEDFDEVFMNNGKKLKYKKYLNKKYKVFRMLKNVSFGLLMVEFDGSSKALNRLKVFLKILTVSLSIVS